ncbi:MAG: ribosome maturation factor RimM [Saccharofermentans sp.]|nr:ribosome maturation factor RimM [Saccharofermentans sp.]
MEDLIVTGKIIGAHGVRGEIKVFPLTDDARRFLSMKRCFLTGPKLEDPKETCVVSARLDKGIVLVMLEGLNDRDKAQALHGRYISVSRSDAVPLPKGRYYTADLIGMTVTDDERGELGQVSDCIEAGSGHILSIKRKGKKDLLIPFVKEYCYDVSVENASIHCRLPDGLYELYE